MKKCKSLGRSKGYEGCGKLSENRSVGLCPACLWNWMVSTEAGKLYKIKVFDVKVEKAILKAAREDKKQQKDNLTNWSAKLQTRLQEISRLIDIGLPCLALGYHAGQIHGGHIFSKGSNKTIALNLHNIHRQSAQSNYSHNDDGLLREKLALEYGRGYLDFILEMRQCEALHYNNLEYMEFYKKANEIALMLKKKGANFDLTGRIEMRNHINLTLGIYPEKYCVWMQ